MNKCNNKIFNYDLLINIIILKYYASTIDISNLSYNYTPICTLLYYSKYI